MNNVEINELVARLKKSIDGRGDLNTDDALLIQAIAALRQVQILQRIADTLGDR